MKTITTIEEIENLFSDKSIDEHCKKINNFIENNFELDQIVSYIFEGKKITDIKIKNLKSKKNIIEKNNTEKQLTFF